MSTPKRPNAIGFLMLPYVTRRSEICAVVMNSPLPLASTPTLYTISFKPEKVSFFNKNSKFFTFFLLMSKKYNTFAAVKSLKSVVLVCKFILKSVSLRVCILLKSVNKYVKKKNYKAFGRGVIFYI